MNVDYLVPTTPANARRLLALQRNNSRIDLDEALVQRAGEGLLTLEYVQARQPESLLPYVYDYMMPVVQHFEDHEYRAILGTRTFEQSLAFSLVCAFTKVSKVLILTDERQNAMNLIKKWLGDHKISYQLMTTPQDILDVDQMVVVANKQACTAEFMRKARDRALVYCVKPNEDKKSFGSFGDFEIELLFDYGSDSMSLDEIVREFQYAIGAFNMNPYDYSANPTKWWDHNAALTLIQAWHPTLVVKNVLSTQNNHANAIAKAGFSLNSPNHIAPMLGINLMLYHKGAHPTPPGNQDAES